MSDYWDTFYTEVYGQDTPPEKAHAWIQWKGTDACIDLHCECGSHGHIDADFLYYYRCAKCGQTYALGSNIKLIKLTQVQADYAATRHELYEDPSLKDEI